MKLKKIIYSFLITSVIIALCSCATKVRVRVTRPAELDLNGAETISVLPIEPCEYFKMSNHSSASEVFVSAFFQIFDGVGYDERGCIRVIEDEINNGLMNSPYIKVVSSSAVQSAISNGTTNPADVYLTGQVTRFDIFDNRDEFRKKHEDDDGNVWYEIEELWSRNVRMDFRYQIVNSSNNRVIAYKTVNMSNSSSSWKHKGDLPSAYSILEYDCKRTAQKILKELQPYSEVKAIKLMEDKSKPKNPEFDHANKMAKDGYVAESQAEFADIYDKTGMMEAGFNAAQLTMALGKLSEAEQQMNDLYKRYPNEKVLEGLYDIRSEIQQANRLKQQTETSDVLEADF